MSWPPFYERGEIRDAASEATWLDAAARVLALHGLPADPPSLFPSGSDVVMRAGELVVKLSAPRWAAQMAHERAVLAMVAGGLSLRTPRVIASGDLDGWPYTVMEFVPGVALARVWHALDLEDRVRIAREIGALLREIQALPVEDASGGDPCLEKLRDSALDRAEARGASPDWLERIEPFLRDRNLSEVSPVWLHTELLDEHLLVQRTDGVWHLSAVIDWADATIGHPYYELPAVAEFIFRGEPPLMRELLLAWGAEAWSLDIEIGLDLLAWGLLHQFGSLPRMLRAVGPPEPGSLDELADRLYGL